MNVRLAAQTFSESVAKVIDFLRDEVAINEFEGSEATTEFINRMNTIFDLLNSRNPYGQGTKAPVSHVNLDTWLQSCQDIANYIFSLKDEKGNYLQTGRRKTAIWGFKFSIESIQSIVQELLNHTYKPYKHVLTYKLSQDHIELLFNKIRRHCGWNNNPNVLEFKYALRRIIIRNSIEPSHTGNFTNFDDTLCQSSGKIDFSYRRKRHFQ